MKPDALIESYVAEVVRHLPRRQRNDVAFELRSLLTEELEGRAADAGREPDSALALELVSGFGRPVDVADRYRPAGFMIVRPSEAPRFAWISLGGVAILWTLSLIEAFTAPATGPADDWLNRLAGWWLTWGIGSFWWPGLLISLSIIAGAIGARRAGREGGESAGEWTPRAAAVLDRDVIRRPLLVLGLAGGLVGAAIVMSLPLLGTLLPGLPQPVIEAFAFDETFLAVRAPWVLLVWAASFAVLIALLVTGRWSTRLRVLSLIGDGLILALLAWWILAGPIFVSEAAESVTKGCLILVAAFVVLDIVLTVRHLPKRIASPA